MAESNSSACKISSYTLNETSSVVSIDPEGNLTINTSAAMESTPFKVSVVVGAQTIEYAFNVTIFDCFPLITFPNLASAYVGEIG